LPTSSRGLGPQRHVSWARPLRRTGRKGRPEEIPTERRVESFADDLNTRLGIVSGRVALLPRSTEIQPKSLRFGPLHRLRPEVPTRSGGGRGRAGAGGVAARPGKLGRVWAARSAQPRASSWEDLGESGRSAGKVRGQVHRKASRPWARSGQSVGKARATLGEARAKCGRFMERHGNIGRGPGEFRARCRSVKKDPRWRNS
jgi:hypothetical protein